VCVYQCIPVYTHTYALLLLQVGKDHLLLALEKSESDRMQAELKQAAAAPLVSWRLDQSVRDTTARCVHTLGGM
jgi:hypothetical protein